MIAPGQDRLLDLAQRIEQRADAGDNPADCTAMADFAAELRRIVAQLAQAYGTIADLAIAYVNAPEDTDACSDAWYELEAAIRHMQAVEAGAAEGGDRG